ncbi:peptidoglycan bridge formation glycyltransferase FemA/FemB family protein [Candidatus Peribacteria bacterium]|nr:peptidoglycan bridge formation glycyltransferase FemA/FemB family protein [Candidatus Peribacteria bacterium]
MDIRCLTSPEDLHAYDQWIKTHPEGSLWQSLEWSQFQKALQREVRIYAQMDAEQIMASALVVIDRTSLGLSTWEIPRGPLMITDYGLRITDFIERIIADAKENGALTIHFSPHLPFRNPKSEIRNSGRFVMPEATRILDLTLNDEALLAQMKPKGRYNIRLAEKHGIDVEQSDDTEAYARLGEETARRDSFRGHKAAFYEHFLRGLPGSFLMLAMTAQKTHVAGLLGVVWGTQATYYYGASSNAHRELMAPYLLQWEAIKYCRSHGCTSYDLFGIAPQAETSPSPLKKHPWASVSEFKAKFGGSVITYPPEQEIILRPVTKTLLRMKRKLLG